MSLGVDGRDQLNEDTAFSLYELKVSTECEEEAALMLRATLSGPSAPSSPHTCPSQNLYLWICSSLNPWFSNCGLVPAETLCLKLSKMMITVVCDKL